MSQWIDFALMIGESELASAISAMDQSERDLAKRDFMALLDISEAELEQSMLRILIERARGLALPSRLWSRSITASTSIKDEARQHLQHLGLSASDERISRINTLYAEFVVSSRKAWVTEMSLTKQGFRCGHCGMAFCDEQLTRIGISSPHGSRLNPKVDQFKLHWSQAAYREPSMDHVWPISLYGSNREENLLILCGGCNNGKSNYLALEHVPAWTGLYARPQLTQNEVPLPLFYAQLRRQPACVRTGVSADKAELTVDLRDPNCPTVLDNLITVVSPGL